MRSFTSFILFLLAHVAVADVYHDAVDDAGRPNSDREQDDRRKPAEVMAFSGVSPGDIVIEIGAGKGYSTELASRICGSKGKVYAAGLDPARIIGNRLSNVVALESGTEDPYEILSGAGLDRGSVDRVLAFFSLHDYYPGDEAEIHRTYQALFDFLKPGGEFIVFDNSAPEGSGLEYVEELHRIDPLFLKNELLDAGFELVSESDVLRNPDDDLLSNWWEDTETRKARYQDRFGYKFRKPR